MADLTEQDLDFIEYALNLTWNDAHKQLTESKSLGDLEREVLTDTRDKAKELLIKLNRI